VSEALQCSHMIALTLETVSGGELLMSRRQAYWLVGAILALIALGGFVLWWPPGAPANGSNQLGAALLGATIIALAQQTIWSLWSEVAFDRVWGRRGRLIG